MKVSELAAKYSLRGVTSGSTGKLLLQLAYFGGGFIVSGGTVFGSFSPFGISLIASVPFSGVFSSLIGSAAGYVVFSAGKSNFRYIAAMLAVLAIRWTLNDLKKLNRHSLYAAAVCFVPTLATGLAMMSVGGFTWGLALAYLIEALLGGVCAYFFSRTFIIAGGTRTLGMLLPQEVACLIMSGCVGLLSLSGIGVGSVSVGRILGGLCILFAARYGGVAGGSVAGIAAGLVLSLSSSTYFFLGAAFSFGGLMAGLFAPAGRIVTGLVFVLSCGIVSLQAGELSTVIGLLYETLGAGMIFVLLPKNAGNFIAAVFRPANSEHSEGLRRSVIMRLDFASKALSDVSSDVEEVAKKLSGVVTPTLDSVYEKAVEKTCARCGMRVYCWEHRDGMTMESFRHVDDKLRQNGSIRSEDLREDFRRKCCRAPEIALAVNQCYKGFLYSEAATRRVEEIRNVVAGQFCGLGDILGEMAEEYENYDYFDSGLSEQVLIKLKELGLKPLDASCRIDYLGRMTVEAEVYDEDRKKLRRALLLHEISRVCGRQFDNPSAASAFGRCRITLCERPALDVEIASSQHICGGGRFCGDHFRYFNDGMGRMITVLSDGMGTGGRAAVDGSMAVSILSKLIQAGLGFDCSLKVVNAALMVKSEDESLATLDVVSVDLYSGVTDFMKAGAALSFIRKEGGLFRVETPSLPVGILPDVDFTYTRDTLSENDIVVMVSDGAVATGEDWIEHILTRWEDKSMQELADLIADEASARRTDGHDDDVTVIAMRVLGRTPLFQSKKGSPLSPS